MTEASNPPGSPLADLDILAIMRVLPHRDPMLLLDRLIDIRAFEQATGIKNVTANEPFFKGHFPGDPIMPGVLIVEAMAQAAAALAMVSNGRGSYGSPVYFMGVDQARFRRPVRPGDQLRIEVKLLRMRLSVLKYACAARVDGELAAEAELTAKLMPPVRSAAA